VIGTYLATPCLKKFAVFRTNPRLKTRIDLDLPRGPFSKLRFPERNFLNHQIVLSLTELFKSRYNASTCIVSQFQFIQEKYSRGGHIVFSRGKNWHQQK